MAGGDKEVESTVVAEKKKVGRPVKSKSTSSSKNSSRTNSPLTVQIDDEAWTCNMCKNKFADPDDKLLECQRCKEHFCITCLKKTVEEYTWMSKSDTMWFCVPCREKVEKNLLVEREIEERCREMASRFDERISTLETKIENKCDKEEVVDLIKTELKNSTPTQKPTTEAATVDAEENMDAIIMEINERKNREGNLIIYGVDELVTNTRQDRNSHDKKVFQEISEVCEVPIEEGDIIYATRMGKFEKEKEKPNRPLLGITLRDPTVKSDLFKGAHKLNTSENFKNVRVTNDLTRKEREQEKRLYQEAKEREEQSGEYTFKVRGPPWGRRIVKLTNKNVNKEQNTTVNSLNCFYTNADQFLNKFDEFQVRIREIKPDIIGITEVKAKNSRYLINPAELTTNWAKNYNMFYTNIDNDIGRGMILYIHEKLNVEEIKLTIEMEENLFIKIKTKEDNCMLVGLIYRSPSDNTDAKNHDLRKLISEVTSINSEHILIMGDFNYPSIDWDLLLAKNENSAEQKFIECVQDNYLFQHVNKPTRWRGTDTPTILDLIITADENCIEDVEYQSPLGKSDHCVITFKYICSVRLRKIKKTRRNYNKANYYEIKKELYQINWNEALTSEGKSVNDMWSKFKSTLRSIEQKHVPITQVKSTQNKVPLGKEVLELIKEKNRLSKKFIQTKDPEVRKKYNRTRNKVSKLVRRARKNYEQNIAQDAKANPKRIWQYINSKSKTRQGISDLCKDPENHKSETTDDDNEKAEILANYFSNVFTKEPEGDTPSMNSKTLIHEWNDLVATKKEILRELENLKPDKSPGIDGMHPKFLKELRHELVDPLHLIFNKSIADKQVPKDWKEASISAIYKKGKKTLASNYRPVSLTSVVSKIMEKLVRNHLIDHFKKNNLFTNKQYGFISGRSTSLQLIRVIEEWMEALDNGLEVDCIYMDYQKAFDKVPHKRLINKLKAYNIGENMIEWIKNYLQGRKQQVKINNSTSSWHNVTSGIPQGSVVGPILFVIYINDLPELVDSTVYLFADDTKIYNVIKEDNDRTTLQRDLEKLTTWSETWLLKFHPEKCKWLHVGRRPPQVGFTYKLVGSELELVQKEKDLGVTVDDKLTFDYHISEKVKKANSMAATIRRSFQSLEEKTFLPLYKAMVRSHVEYASSVWCPYKEKHIEMIEGVQRRATKQIPGYKDLTYEERLKKLKLPTLKYRRLRGDMIEIFKITNGIYDSNVCEFIQLRSNYSTREIRGNSKTLVTQRTRYNTRKYSFTVRSANAWNSLPEYVVSASNTNTFKNRLDKLWRNQDMIYDYKSDIEVRTGTGSRPNTSSCRQEVTTEESGEEDPWGPELETNLK